MIDALSAHDAVAMRAVLASHLANKRDVVIEQLRDAAPTNISTSQS
jgi:DNA-binding GntR family transcriptional regulator